MNNIESANIIKTLCKQKGIPINTLLLACNIRKGLIYDMEKRDKIPSAQIFEQIADYLDCSVDYLLGRTDNPEVNRSIVKDTRRNEPYNKEIAPIVTEEPSIYKAGKRIAILGKVAAGTPILSYEVDYGTVIPEDPSASYALIAQGDSMHPVILDRETIEVVNQNVLEQGEIGIISVDGDVTCKKFYDFPDHYELRPINPDFQTIFVPKNPSTDLQIRGKVSLTRAQMNRF